MVAHRLVEVHAVEDRRVVAGEELVRDDEDLWELVRLRERLADLLLARLIKLVLRDKRPIDHVERVLRVNGGRPLGR